MFLRLVLHFLQAFRVHIAFPAYIPVLFPLFISSDTSSHCIFPSIISHFFYLFPKNQERCLTFQEVSLCLSGMVVFYVIAANKKIQKHVYN